MKGKWVLVCAALMAASVAFAGGSRESVQGSVPKKLTVGISIQGNTSTFMQYVVAGMLDYVKDMHDVELKIVYADMRADKQVGQIETFIAQKVDAIILNPIDKEASAPAVDAAVKAKIPIVTVNTKTSNQEKALAFSGSDAIESGELQAQHVVDLLGGRGNVAILHGSMGHEAQIGRRTGYMNVFAKYPGIKVIYEQSADWATDKAQTIMENWIQRGERIDAVLANCDTMAIGAQNAIDANGLRGKTVVAGMDAIPDVMKSIKDGVIADTIWQDGIGQGAKSVELAIKAARGENIADAYIPYELVTKQNIDQYYKRANERDALVAKYF